MKTAEERAAALLYAIKFTSDDKQSTDRIIEALKKEQEITRHACAVEIKNKIMNTKAI